MPQPAREAQDRHPPAGEIAAVATETGWNVPLNREHEENLGTWNQARSFRI